MTARTVLAPIALALALNACGGSTHTFRDDAFYHGEYNYRVTHGPAGSVLPSADWYVDNFQVDKKGQLSSLKGGPDYQHVIRLDSDGDGDLDASRKIASYDLLLRNLKNDGRIWVRTLPMSQQFRATELRVLALNLVDAVSGAGQLVVDLQGEKVGVERRFATRVLDSATGTLDGHEAYDVTFEVANVDQLQLAKDSRWERARIIMLRPGFHYPVGKASFPVLMLLGYSNRPEDFEQGHAAFEQLIDHVQFVSDEDMLARESEAVFDCRSEKDDKLTVIVDTDARGNVTWAGAHAPSEPAPSPPMTESARTCVERAVTGLKFAATGRVRRLVVAVQRGAAGSPRPSQGYVRGQSTAAAEVAADSANDAQTAEEQAAMPTADTAPDPTAVPPAAAAAATTPAAP